MKIALVILALCSAIAMAVVGVVMWRRQATEKRRSQDERRKRFSIPETTERVPLAPEKAPESAPAPIEDLPLPDSRRSVHTPAPRSKVTGRIVNTPDGEMILTTPPFVLREAIFSQKIGRFVNGISRRSPAWIVVCPKVRLDTLITPTSPDGRDPADWREWRRRVRMRSVDLVIVDRRTWKPLLAVAFVHADIDARKIAGGAAGANPTGADRIIDEVLHHVGLPFLRLSGDFEQDWPVIKPYIEDTILPAISDDHAALADRPAPVDGDSAVTLLRMDGQKGWLLE